MIKKKEREERTDESRSIVFLLISYPFLVAADRDPRKKKKQSGKKMEKRAESAIAPPLVISLSF